MAVVVESVHQLLGTLHQRIAFPDWVEILEDKKSIPSKSLESGRHRRSNETDGADREPDGDEILGNGDQEIFHGKFFHESGPGLISSEGSSDGDNSAENAEGNAL